MSDDSKPDFFGGIPVRNESSAASEAPAELSPKPQKKPPRRLIMLSGATVVAVALVASTAALVGNVISDGAADDRPVTPAPEATFSAEEIEQAEEAIASGGGAVPGHIVSAELCNAVDAFIAAGDETADEPSTEVPAKVLAAMESLAAVDSPNQEIYRRNVEMTRDPASVPSAEDAQTIASDFANALQVDVATCM